MIVHSATLTRMSHIFLFVSKTLSVDRTKAFIMSPFLFVFGSMLLYKDKYKIDTVEFTFNL